jgi:leucyl-tRNA synthetase
MPDVPGALYEPGLERWLDYTSEEHLRWVQVPPEEPAMPDTSADQDEQRLWLAAQNAILAYTTPITKRNSLPAIRARLVRLTKAVSNYEEAYCVVFDMHYYSACVLLSLLAPSAPAFAEECWVLLHYGNQQDIGEEDESDNYLNESAIQEIITKTENTLGRYHLARQGQPDTLQSIFDQPFPVVSEDLLSFRHTRPNAASNPRR